MKNLLYLVAVVAALTMSGCKYVFEDEGECTRQLDHNLVLHFSNTDNDGTEIFSTTIDKVQIFLFDESDRLVYRFEAPQAELTATKSATLTVAPGTYRVVCWGNAKTNTMIAINDREHLGDGYVYKQAVSGEIVANGNPLYYAPYNRQEPQTFIVPEDTRKDVDVRFRAAHIKMEFIVKGYAAATGETTHPYIEITTLYPKYNFVMDYLPTPALNYVQQTGTTTKATSNETYAYFNTPRFENDNPVVIHLRKDPYSQPIKSLILKDELLVKSIDVSRTVEVTLPFVIEFSGTDVSITLEGWKPNPLDPNAN